MLHRVVTLTLLLIALPAILPAEVLPAEDMSIVGRVLGPDGEPPKKTEVWLEPIPSTHERARLRLEGRPGPEAVARTRPGADGSFELAAPEAGMWKVVVSAPGLLTMECRLIPLVEAAVVPTVELTPVADLEVKLIDAEGKPRPGMVGAFTLGIRNESWRPQLRLAAAGEDGVARLPLGRDEKIQLEILADGHPLDVFELYDESSVEITVPDGIAGTVRIVDRHRRPLAGAVAFQGSALLPLGLSDEEGRIPLVLRAEDPGTVKVATADLWNGSFEPDLAAEGGKAKDLRLDPPSTIRGRVLDLESRDPVADALVWAVRGQIALTDKQGSYALDIGVYKSRWLQAAAPGYQKGHGRLQEDAPGDAPAIALAPAAGLSGRVVDVDGGALGDVEIDLSVAPTSGRVSSAVRRMMRDGWRGQTSEKGNFRVVGLPSGVGLRLELKRQGFAPYTLEVEPLEPFERRSGLEVVLEAGRIAFGRVVDESDVPIAGAEVGLEAPPPTGDPRVAMRMMQRHRDDVGIPTRLTDAEGRFEIADLAPGRYDLAVRATGFAPARVPGVRVTEDGGRVDFGTVIMVPGAAIEGRVTDPDGGDIAGADVAVNLGRRGFSVINQDSGKHGQAKTDSKGRFVIADLTPDQPVALVVTKEGFGSQYLADVRPPPEEPLAIVLQPAGRLAGKVVDEGGDPVPGANVMVNQDHRAMTRATMAQRRRPTWGRAEKDGRYEIADVEPGTMMVTVQAEGFQEQMRSGIEVAAGAELELDFVLEAGGIVEGTVTTADGKPVVQANVNISEQQEVYSASSMISAGGRTDVEGRYRVAGAPLGRATITVSHDSGQRLRKNVELQPGTNVVDLVLERGFEVSGQVVGPDGTPAGGASVSIQPASQAAMMHFSIGSSQEVSAAGGTFTLAGVKEGKYVVQAAKEGYAPARSEPFEVSGDVSGVLLELRRGATIAGQVLGLELDELGTLELVAYSQQGGMRRGQVDFSARFSFENLAPGQWHVQGQVTSSGRSTMVQVEVPEGVLEVEQDLEFGTGFSLAGIVLDGGQPLVGANVTVAGSMASSGHGATGTDGRFRIENLKAGTYQVMVMAGMGVQHSEALELVGDHELRIEISTGSISGTLRDATDGEPLAGASVMVERLDAGDDPWARQFGFGNQSESDSSGRFRVPRVRQGTWRVVASKSGYAPGVATAVVAGGSSPEVEIQMTPTEGVSFELALESGVAVPMVQVAILDPSGRRIASGNYSVIEGRVRVSTVPPGRWDLVVQAGDSAATRFAVNAPGDQGRLTLPIGGTLHIVVPQLEQVAIAKIRLTGPDGKLFVFISGFALGPGEWLLSGGQTMVPGLTPGTWSFTVEHEGLTFNGSATVSPGTMTEVSLR
ncbi:MAG: carboxypeptidase regulatory-like domain-containing protein [bacterium]|nr:carboxypeptidase regulatory-like domain-containing protein [bacterium]